MTPEIYSANDFKQACASLLPPGEYWQYEAGDELDCLLSALSSEFKSTHDETTSLLLFEGDKNQIGWKLADYQTLLNSFSITGTVFDKSTEPNLIFIDCAQSSQLGYLMWQFEDRRLPHTAFFWEIQQSVELYFAVTSNTLKIERTDHCLNSNETRTASVYCLGVKQSLIIKRENSTLSGDETRVATVKCVAGEHSLVIHRTQMRAV